MDDETTIQFRNSCSGSALPSSPKILSWGDANLEKDDPESRRVAAAIVRHYNSDLQQYQQCPTSSRDSDTDHDVQNAADTTEQQFSEPTFFLDENGVQVDDNRVVSMETKGSSHERLSHTTSSASRGSLSDYRSQISRAEYCYRNRYHLKGPFWTEVGSLQEETEILREELKLVRLQRIVEDLKLQMNEIASRVFYKTAFGYHSSQLDMCIHQITTQVCSSLEQTVLDSSSLPCILLRRIPSGGPPDSMVFGSTANCERLVEVSSSHWPHKEAENQESFSESFFVASLSKRVACSISGRTRQSFDKEDTFLKLVSADLPEEKIGALTITSWLEAIAKNFVEGNPLQHKHLIVYNLYLRGKRPVGSNSKPIPHNGLFTPIIVCDQLYIAGILLRVLTEQNDEPTLHAQPVYCPARLRTSSEIACYNSVPVSKTTGVLDVRCDEEDETPAEELTFNQRDNSGGFNISALSKNRLAICQAASNSTTTCDDKEGSQENMKTANTITNNLSTERSQSNISSQSTCSNFNKIELWEDLSELLKKLASTVGPQFIEAFSTLSLGTFSGVFSAPPH